MDPKDHKVGLGETHHHDKGYCDLPARNIKAVLAHESDLSDPENPLKRSESCSYDFVYTGVGICSCLMCSARDSRKQQVRRARHSTKGSLTKEMKKAQAVMNDNADFEEDDLGDLETPWVSPNLWT